MSRGLGRQQRLFLHALWELERQHGRHWFHTWGVINEAARLGMAQDVTYRRDRRDAEYEDWDRDRQKAEDQWRAEMRAAADAGDATAAAELERLRALENRLTVLTFALRRRGKEWRGAPRLRGLPDAERLVNPTRVLALLQRRGLVKRDAARGPLSMVSLTDAGRTMKPAAQDVADHMADEAV